MTLTEFLLARIAEDDAAIRRATQYTYGELSEKGYYDWGNDFVSGVGIASDRALTECDAKRRMVEHFSEQLDLGGAKGNGAEWVLGFLCLPYANHSDYQPKWGNL